MMRIVRSSDIPEGSSMGSGETDSGPAALEHL